MVSTPEPPDPVATASAQAQYNQQTAATTQAMNMVDQFGPNGSQVYNQTGTNTVIGADGKPIQVPHYSQTTTLSPEQQAIKAQSDQASLNLGTLAAQQSDKLKDYLNTPFEFNNTDAENWAYDLGAQRLDPRFAQENDQLRTQLINSGIRPGTAAYDQQMQQLGQTKNDAYNQLALNGRQQAYTEALQQRNQPINEISALMSGSQVSMPQFGATPQTGVGGVDYTGLVNNQYQAQVANSNAAMGGLFGLAAAPFSMFKFSDRRLKTDIRKVGMLDNGLPVYAYRMNDGPVQIGVMADEVEKVMPAAVVNHPSGFKMVDYSMATEA